ncbi:MAG: hypothetical protein R3E96_13440 [Planctomycetota bacterium]
MGGEQRHLSNDQAAQMLPYLSDRLHTLVLAHLSAHNNRPELAVEAATTTLERLGLGHVQVVLAKQDEATAPIDV